MGFPSKPRWTVLATIAVLLTTLIVGYAVAQSNVSLDAPATLPADI